FEPLAPRVERRVHLLQIGLPRENGGPRRERLRPREEERDREHGPARIEEDRPRRELAPRLLRPREEVRVERPRVRRREREPDRDRELGAALADLLPHLGREPL